MDDDICTVSLDSATTGPYDRPVQRVLVVGIAALFVSNVMLKLFAASAGMVFSTGTLTVVTDLAVTVALAPLAIVFSFVLRIAAVARRTVAITPFTTASQLSATHR